MEMPGSARENPLLREVSRWPGDEEITPGNERRIMFQHISTVPCSMISVSSGFGVHVHRCQPRHAGGLPPAQARSMGLCALERAKQGQRLEH